MASSLNSNYDLDFKNPPFGAKNVRTFETKLSNQELAAKGLVLLNPPLQSGNFSIVGDLGEGWSKSIPIMLSTSVDYSDLLTPAGPKVIRWTAAFEERLRELDLAAAEDEIAASPDSRADAHSFATALQGARKPQVFLVGNGNFRLRWKNELGETVGLQFLGRGEIQYLFLKKGVGKFLPHQGIMPVSEIESCIASLGMRHVITE